jgi:hypothetical protein
MDATGNPDHGQAGFNNMFHAMTLAAGTHDTSMLTQVGHTLGEQNMARHISPASRPPAQPAPLPPVSPPAPPATTGVTQHGAGYRLGPTDDTRRFRQALTDDYTRDL